VNNLHSITLYKLHN